MNAPVRIHPTADVSTDAQIGAGTAVWHQCQVREGARIGANCILSKGVYVDTGVALGDNVKVQNYVSLYRGVTLEDGVFCGPHCVFTNDKRPRAVNPDGSLKAGDDWELVRTRVGAGAAIGANAVVVCGVTIGAWAIVGAGSVVTHDVPEHGLAFGNPARLRGFVCRCGARLSPKKKKQASEETGTSVLLRCGECGSQVEVKKDDWECVR
jgi:acetyltransferase-like isoleucine patch superfamily enzyme